MKMISITQRVLLMVFLVLDCGAFAAAGEYKDQNGFSFTYPEGWMPLNGEIMSSAEARSHFPPDLQRVIDRGQLDLSKIAVALFRVGPEDFVENMNVVVEKKQIPVNDAAVKELTGALRQQAATVGMSMDNLQGSVTKVSNRDAIMLNYDTKIPGVPTPMRQRQYYVPGGGKTFIITCTATSNTSATYQPIFDQIIASFQAPTPIAIGFNWNQTLMTGVVGGIAGAVVGLILWVKNKFTAKPKAA